MKYELRQLRARFHPQSRFEALPAALPLVTLAFEPI